MEAGAYEQAAAAFLRSISRDKNLPIAYYGLGQAYMARERYDDAVVAFVHAIDSLPPANLSLREHNPAVWQHTTSETQRERREA
jgi:tetratricopeptide (TPR) repeat protein